MNENSDIVIYHNPACGTSRNTLAMIRAAGSEPTVIEYLKAGWTREKLDALLLAMGLRPRDLLRDKGTPAAELGLLDAGVEDERILQMMIAHPILVNRPIVTSPKGAKLCRPSEVVLDLLDHHPDRFVKEDGEIVRPKPGAPAD